MARHGTRPKLTSEMRKALKVERNAATSEKAWARYQAELGGVAKREAERQFQQDGIDYIDGLDTEGARRFAEEVKRRLDAAAAADKRITAEGNPLKISGPKQPLPEPVQRKIEKKQMAAAGYAKEPVTVTNNDGSEEKADVWHGQFTFRRMKLENTHIKAAARLDRDLKAARCGLRGQSWEMPVDGQSSAHALHLASVNARARLLACQAEIGKRNFDIAVGVVSGATAGKIHALGGNQIVAVSADIRTALDALDAFYHGTRRKDSTWKAFEEFNAEREAMIAQGEREVAGPPRNGRPSRKSLI